MEAVQEASVLARDREIRTTVDGADGRPIIRADPRRLKQAILIVLDNALKYSDPESCIGVGVSLTNGYAEINVRNDGTVIPPDELPYVFERFYRGANAPKTGGGSGLGLAIARWIVEKHDGGIDLSSSASEGTQVRIQLPAMSSP
jgi:signal transduction histidine kinase